MAVPALLFELEQLDIQLERREAELVDARQAQTRNRELEQAEARLEQLRDKEREAATAQRSLETDLNDLEGKIKRTQTRLYGGQVVDPRELASLEKELEHHRAQREVLEEQVLLAMERLETLQGAVATSTEQARELRHRWEAEQPALSRRIAENEDTLARLRAEREALAASLDAPSLNMYRRLRTASGHAVSSVSNGVCQWCRVTIPPKDVQHARSGSLVTCSNCARILYVGR